MKINLKDFMNMKFGFNESSGTATIISNNENEIYELDKDNAQA